MKANSPHGNGEAEELDERFRGALRRLDEFHIDFTGPYATSKGYVIEIERRLLTTHEVLGLFDGQPSRPIIARIALLEKIHKIPRE